MPKKIDNSPKFIIWDKRNNCQFMGSTKKEWKSTGAAKNGLLGHIMCNYFPDELTKLFNQSELPIKQLSSLDAPDAFRGDFEDGFKFSNQTRFEVRPK